MKGQLSSCRTSSTVSCSQADNSWTPWFLPEERRLDEDERAEDEGGRTGLEGLGGGVTSGGGEGRSLLVLLMFNIKVQFRQVLYIHLSNPNPTSCLPVGR